MVQQKIIVTLLIHLIKRHNKLDKKQNRGRDASRRQELEQIKKNLSEKRERETKKENYERNMLI